MGVTQAPDPGGAHRDPLVIVEMTEHHVLATWRNIGIVLWIDETTADADARAQAMLALLAKEHPDAQARIQHRAKFPPAASIRPRTSWRPKPRKS